MGSGAWRRPRMSSADAAEERAARFERRQDGVRLGRVVDPADADQPRSGNSGHFNLHACCREVAAVQQDGSRMVYSNYFRAIVAR